jgi:transglutaminase-like putative cysteine protease
MRVTVGHTTRLDYDGEVVEGVMEARLGPFSDDHQRWGDFELSTDPPTPAWRFSDAFGNETHLVTLARPHRSVHLATVGEVETLMADPFALPAFRPRALTPGEQADYLSPSARVPLLPELQALADPHRPAEPDRAFDAVHALMGLVYSSFTYQKDVTTVRTTVPDVLADLRGVCQDFAHVLIGLCRSIEIPARYVSGYIVSIAASQSQSQTSGSQSQSQTGDSIPMRGARASHAWIEAYTPTHGWRGFDPTNNLVASEHHVKMAIGRDYDDVPPTRGTFRGDATEHLTVDVTSEPVGSGQ